ncbi:hypothetical protein L798_13609, partial [Zootermopsis nevadensis]
MKTNKVGNQTNSQDPQAVNSRVFVGNLNTFHCSKIDAERIFQRYGRIAGISMHKGYAFVQFTNPFDARSACLGEDGRKVLGQTLDVNLVAEPKPHQTGRKRQNVAKTGNDWDYYYDSSYSFSTSALEGEGGGGGGGRRGLGRLLKEEPLLNDVFFEIVFSLQETATVSCCGRCNISTCQEQVSKSLLVACYSKEPAQSLRKRGVRRSAKIPPHLPNRNLALLSPRLLSPEIVCTFIKYESGNVHFAVWRAKYTVKHLTPRSKLVRHSLNSALNKKKCTTPQNKQAVVQTKMESSTLKMETVCFPKCWLSTYDNPQEQHRYILVNPIRDSYYASASFPPGPPRIVPPPKRPRLMVPPARPVIKAPHSKKVQPPLNQLKIYSNPDILICGNCREMFTELQELLDHKKTYCKLRFTCKCHTLNGINNRDDSSSTAMLLCVLCKDSFPGAWDLMVHVQAAHMVTIYELG